MLAVKQRNIQIVEDPQTQTSQAAEPRKLDLQDTLLIAGFACLEIGIARISVSAALVVAGVLFFGFAYLIEVSKKNK